MSGVDPGEAAQPQSELFQPPPGGDLTVRSKDGIEFQVHTVLLGLGSSVFQGMLTSGTKDEAINLGEDSETLSLMLRFIYPNETPILRTLREFKDGFEVAQKYEMAGVTRTLDQQLCLGLKNKTGPEQFDPLLVCELANTYDLQETKKIAPRLVTIDRCDLRTPAKLTDLAAKNPSFSTIIGLVGVQSARTKIISRILFTFHSHPMRWRVSNRPKYYIMCHDCRERSEDLGLTQVPPAWLVSWASYVYQPLLSRSPDRLPLLFDVRVLEMLDQLYPSAICPECVYEIQSDAALRGKFCEWAAGMKEHIEKQLESLESLYALC